MSQHSSSTFSWDLVGPEGYAGHSGEVQARCDPLQGLAVQVGPLRLERILGVEIIDAVDLGVKRLAAPGVMPEVVCRQNSLHVRYQPTADRPVECHALWRIEPEGIFDLEVSALTPGKWSGLAVQTISQFSQGETVLLPGMTPNIVLFRPQGLEMTYAEFCHPDDGIGVASNSPASPSGQEVRFRLFGHDLEKGVILRGRLRGMVVPRPVDEAVARAAYARFLREPPPLT